MTVFKQKQKRLSVVLCIQKTSLTFIVKEKLLLSPFIHVRYLSILIYDSVNKV